jgi:type III pantothenate kinase
MGYYLTIDQGNSAAKVATWLDDKLINESWYGTLTEADINELSSRYVFDAAIYSSVSARGEDILKALANVTDHIYELTADTPLPIKIDYATPHTLGRDRIAAVVGAQSHYPGHWLLVVDMGTAITYDVLSPDGHFIGGNIAPGVFMRLEALNHYTSRLPMVETSGNVPMWGQTTEEALRAGAINGVVGEIEHYRSQLPQPVEVVVTGGAYDLIVGRTTFPIHVDRHLVSKGLNCIIRYNENK